MEAKGVNAKVLHPFDILEMFMNKTKKLTVTALLCAMAYIAVFIAKLLPISIISFLKYDPKDAIIVMGGFMFGPACAAVISVAVSLAEMLTISETFLYGFFMNVVSTCTFACTAAVIYRANKSFKGALAALFAGSATTALAMMVFNYVVTPFYMGIPRTAVGAMLLPVFLPFNVIKCLLNSALAILLYKPLVRILRRSGMLEQNERNGKSNNRGSIFAAVFIIAVCILALLILKKL